MKFNFDKEIECKNPYGFYLNKEEIIICEGCPIPAPEYVTTNRFFCASNVGKCQNHEKRKQMVREKFGNDYYFGEDI